MKTPPSSALKTLSTLALVALIAGLLYLSVRVTNPDFVRLVTAAPKARQMLGQLLQPDLFTREAEMAQLDLPFPIPCGSAPEGVPATGGTSLRADPACADSGRVPFTLTGSGFPPGADIKLSWALPNGSILPVTRVKAAADGTFTAAMQTRPIAVTVDGVPSSLRAEWMLPGGKLRPSQTLIDVTNNIMVTIFMALLATTIGTILAAPLSFLAAQNITRKGVLGSTVYYLMRGIFNVARSFEPLVMALIFALIVGFGPYAGVLGMTVMTFASLGKMFSEAVESIDPGPIEALQATGANRWLVVRYAVVPQIVPDFLSFIIYHWDINVRISTIIGFVGGGGIGYLLSQQISTLSYHQASTSLLLIVTVVMAMDFLSAEVRKRLT